MPSESPPPHFVTGLRELAANYDVILCDVWGVIHNGVVQYEKATDACGIFAKGAALSFSSPTPPRARARVESFLDNLHVPREAYDGIVTSGDVTISLISRTRRSAAGLHRAAGGYVAL